MIFPDTHQIVAEYISKPMRLSAKVCLLGCIAALFLLACLHAQDIALDLGGGVKMEFICVPVEGLDGTTTIKIGDFSGTKVSEPVRSESISGPFQQAGRGFGYYLGKAEVTEAQWAIVTGAGSKSQAPTTEKTFNQIQNFIEAVNSKSGQSASLPHTVDGVAGVFRLPTEAEVADQSEL